jgi:hypothetical protein
LQLTAIFEAWHFGDGNYQPRDKNRLVNLSFEVEEDVFSKCATPQLRDIAVYLDKPGP